MLKIVADRNITFVEEAFSSLGQVHAVSAAEITPALVKDADLLLVRSTVKVGPRLLDQSRVRFVATATIGVDHLDATYLKARQIEWASAPGSNADSVVQWFAAATATLAVRRAISLGALKVGIVGVGQVGGRIAHYCRALGGEPLLCDPPRARREGSTEFVALDTLIENSDLVTVHVPLEKKGEDATFHLFDASRIARLSDRAILVNASRGEVIDEHALCERLDERPLGGLLLDVFENEPCPDQNVIARADVATPHIAGHSLDGKVAGTLMIYQAACRFLQVAPCWQPNLRVIKEARVLPTAGQSDEALLLSAIAPFYDLAADDSRLRAIAQLEPVERGPAFRAYREQYPERRELKGAVIGFDRPRPRLEAQLACLGATVPER